MQGLSYFLFLSTLSLRRATQVKQTCRAKISISIHALLAESDVMNALKLANAMLFLSTLSLRRATVLALCSCGGAFDFYPRSPCGERPGYQRPCEHPTKDFYPRSPCGERQPATSRNDKHNIFLSTLSLRRATREKVTSGYDRSDFYPRSPCGERQTSSRQ